jgi:hypothetical protein
LVNHLEVTASYWEARIKTYGFHRLTDLSLFELTLDSFELPLFGRALCRMGEEGIPLVLTFCWGPSQGLAACFVVPRAFEGEVRDRLREETALSGEEAIRALPVEVVYFYGPHFGDRYGIAEAALKVLAASGIRATATACSGSCVYLVLREGQSEEAVRALSRTFEIPKAMSQKAAVAN